MILRFAAALLLVPLIPTASPQEDYAAPYRILREANLNLDPDLAASAYAEGGVLIFEHAGRPLEMFQGQDEIRHAYVRTFSQVDAGTPIDIEFRFEPPGLVSKRQSGAYRLTAKVGGRTITAHGRFTVKLVKQDSQWRFAEDRGAVAGAADFEKLPGAALDWQQKGRPRMRPPFAFAKPLP
jgi:hypothetical protein